MKWRGVEHMPRLYELCALRSEAGLRPLRQRLLADLRGLVLEVGVGIGLNLAHYSPAAQVIGFDLDPQNVRHALRRQRPNSSLLAADAQALPIPDRSVDQIVATLVLCSVPSQALTLAEFRRVLRPGGQIHLLEHTLTNLPLLNRLLHAVEQPWAWFTGGCHPNRATAEMLHQQGWRLVQHEQYANGLLRMIVAE